MRSSEARARTGFRARLAIKTNFPLSKGRGREGNAEHGTDEHGGAGTHWGEAKKNGHVFNLQQCWA